MMGENTNVVENSISTQTGVIQTDTTSQDSASTTDIDPPAADTAAAAVKRHEAQQARLKEQSDKRQQWLQDYQDRYQAHIETMQTTKSTVRSEKMS